LADIGPCAAAEEFACNGSLVDDEEMGTVIQLQGDQRTKILEILLQEGIGKPKPLTRYADLIEI